MRSSWAAVKSVFGGANLRLGGLDVRAAGEGLLERIVERESGRRGERDIIGQLIVLVWRKAGHARQGNLLLGQLRFQRDDALLLGELFDFAAVDVNLGREAGGPLLERLLVERGCGVQLGVRGLDALAGGDDLEVCSGDREDDRVAGVAGRKLSGAIEVAGRAIVVPGGEIDDRLRDAAAQIDIVVGTDDSGKGEAGNGNVNFHSFRGKIYLVQGLGEIAAGIGKQGAAGDLALALGQTHGVALAESAKVVFEAAIDGIAKRELAGGRQVGRAAGTAGIRTLDLHGGVDGDYAVGRPGDGSLHRGDRAVAASASGERQGVGLRVLRLGGLGWALGKRWSGDGKSRQAHEECGSGDGRNWGVLCLRTIHIDDPLRLS
jgi:hypothetical protein